MDHNSHLTNRYTAVRLGNQNYKGGKKTKLHPNLQHPNLMPYLWALSAKSTWHKYSGLKTCQHNKDYFNTIPIAPCWPPATANIKVPPLSNFQFSELNELVLPSAIESASEACLICWLVWHLLWANTSFIHVKLLGLQIFIFRSWRDQKKKRHKVLV